MRSAITHGKYWRQNARWTGRGGSALSPLNAVQQMNAAGLFTAWWNTDDQTSVWLASDETGGNVTADGDTIGKIDDQTANGYNITQATAAQEPRYSRRLKANADLSGQAELVPSGNWTARSDATLSNQTDGGCRIQAGAADQFVGADKSYNGFVVGNLYQITIDTITDTDTDIYTLRVGTDPVFSAGSIINSGGVSAGTFEFIATATTLYFGFWVDKSPGSADFSFAGFSIKEAPDAATFYTFDTDGSDDSIGNTSMTLSSDCSVFFTAMRLDNNPGVILSGTSAVNGRWIGIYGSGGTAPLSSNAGSPTFYVDGSQVVNSGELYTALAGPNMNLFEARNVDMVTSPWAGVVFSGHGSVKPNIALGPHAIIIPTANLTPARRADIVAFLNGSVGI